MGEDGGFVVALVDAEGVEDAPGDGLVVVSI